jgi:hypothetical protein
MAHNFDLCTPLFRVFLVDTHYVYPDDCVLIAYAQSAERIVEVLAYIEDMIAHRDLFLRMRAAPCIRQHLIVKILVGPGMDSVASYRHGLNISFEDNEPKSWFGNI